ncbi:MAG: WxcM-like domain-containing protein [Bergeyella sp.]|nr:WxcM-like domain-containing protein [Bergeyella sp.]
MFNVEDCDIVELPIVHSEKGNITVLENGAGIPFDIRRIYYLYDIPTGAGRGGHSHYRLQQFVVAVGGSFTFLLDDGTREKEVFLNRPDKALLIKPGIWREIKDFSGGSICLVLASLKYSEDDYIRDYGDFLDFRRNG